MANTYSNRPFPDVPALLDPSDEVKSELVATQPGINGQLPVERDVGSSGSGQDAAREHWHRTGPYTFVRGLRSTSRASLFVADRVSAGGPVHRATIKRVARHGSDFALGRLRLLRELRTMSAVRHPNIAMALDFGDDEHGTWLARQYVDGVDLGQLSEVLRRRGEALPFILAAHATIEILRGLYPLHGAESDGGQSLALVHRALHPGSVLVARSGHVSLIDLGHVAEAPEIAERTGEWPPESCYLAPECLLGQPGDARSDLYSVGLILFELLIGRPCFRDRDHGEIRRKIALGDLRLERMQKEGVPEPLREIVNQATRLSRDERFSTAEDMIVAIETWAFGANTPMGPAVFAAFLASHRLLDSEPMVRLDTTDAGGTLSHAPERVESSALITHVTASGERPVAHAPQEPKTDRARPSLAPNPSPLPRESTEPAAVVGGEKDAPAYFQPRPSLPPWGGDLTQTRVSAVLAWIVARYATGTVTLSSGPVKKRLMVAEGRPIALESNVGMENVGDELVRSRVVRRADWDQALRESRRGEDGVIERLLEVGLVQTEAMALALGRCIADGLMETFLWRGGAFEFAPGPVEKTRVMPELDLMELLERDPQAKRPIRPSGPTDGLAVPHELSRTEDIPRARVSEPPQPTDGTHTSNRGPKSR